MTYFYQDDFSSSEVAGAVAEAAIYDLRVNKSPFPGFPQIHVSDTIDDVFNITLSWNASSESSASFELTFKEAKAAVEEVPTVLKESATKEEAEEIKKQVEEAGAACELK